MPAVAPGAVVAVTGANGFIGSHVCKKLLEDGYSVRAVVRDPSDAAKVVDMPRISFGRAFTDTFTCAPAVAPVPQTLVDASR